MRRAALGVVRVALEGNLRMPLDRITLSAFVGIFWTVGVTVEATEKRFKAVVNETISEARRLTPDLLSFFHDRLKVYLRDRAPVTTSSMPC